MFWIIHFWIYFQKAPFAQQKQKSPPCDGDFLTDRRELHVAEAGVYFAENVADDRAEDHESGDHDDGDQNEN